MTPDPRKALARRIADELLTQGDLAIADVVFAPNLFHHGLSSLSPGIAGVKDCTRMLRHACRDFFASVEDEIAEGNRVVLRLTLSGTPQPVEGGPAAPDARARCEWVVILRLNDNGQVVESWWSPAVDAVMAQLGPRSSAAPGRTVEATHGQCQ